MKAFRMLALELEVCIGAVMGFCPSRAPLWGLSLGESGSTNCHALVGWNLSSYGPGCGRIHDPGHSPCVDAVSPRSAEEYNIEPLDVAHQEVRVLKGCWKSLTCARTSCRSPCVSGLHGLECYSLCSCEEWFKF